MKMRDGEVGIDAGLVRRLVAAPFPCWPAGGTARRQSAASMTTGPCSASPASM